MAKTVLVLFFRKHLLIFVLIIISVFLTSPDQLLAANIITTVDSAGDVGTWSSLAIGTDGNPVISYCKFLNNVDTNLKVIKCGNPSCTLGNSITTVDPAVNVGRYSSLAIGNDGNPVISYLKYNVPNGNLNVIKCGNNSCTAGNTITTIDSAGSVGYFTSIAIGTDGNPVISYFDFTNTNLKFVKCGNPSCTLGNSITTVDSIGDVGKASSLAIGNDGNPVISYYNFTNTNLKFVKCGNSTCTSGNTFTIIDPGPSSGDSSSISIGTDGNPVISYHASSGLKFVKCGNSTCTSGNTITIVDSGDVGWYNSLALGTDTYPVMSYYDYSNGTKSDLKVAKCGSSNCGEYIDIGLRIYDGNAVVSIAAEPMGTLNSSLRIAKNGVIYGIGLVDPADPDASKIRIKTSTGIKSLRKF